jgi:hypothetical protein
MEKYLVILLAEKMNHLRQSNGLESVDSEMQSPAYKSGSCSILLLPHLLPG